MKKILSAFIMMLFVFIAQAQSELSTIAKQLINKMTLEEKAKLVVGMGMKIPGMQPGPPAYEFGYGLSYTHFTYSNLKLSSAEFSGKITATVDVTNSGHVAGKEAVQLYISRPSKELKKPAEELRHLLRQIY